MSRVWSRTSLSELLVAPIPKRDELRRYSWLFDILRVEGSITGRIIGPVLTVTLFATLVAVADIVYGKNIHLTNNVVPLLSVVVGLILVFRNGTSYDRWYEGSKDWETTISNVRNLSRQIWINVAAPPANFVRRSQTAGSTHIPMKAEEVHQAKIRALNLVAAYSFAVMHHLRNEPGVQHDDMSDLLPDEFSKYDQETSISHEHSGEYSSPLNMSGQNSPIVPTRIKDVGTSKTLVDQRTPPLKDQHHTVHFHSYGAPSTLSLPLIIAHELTRLVHRFRLDGCLEDVGPAGVNGMNTLIQNMVNQLAKMERVSSTPIPAAYGIHLKQCVSLYLFTLPFTLIGDLGWFMIPVVTVVSFTLMGIEGIADEIEMPFGRDYYDLPLDRQCADMRAEIEYIVQRLPEGSDEYDY